MEPGAGSRWTQFLATERLFGVDGALDCKLEAQDRAQQGCRTPHGKGKSWSLGILHGSAKLPRLGTPMGGGERRQMPPHSELSMNPGTHPW